LEPKRKSRANWFRAAFLFVTLTSAYGTVAALFHPDSPLPNQWNPLKQLDITELITPLTAWKLSQAQQNAQLCIAILSKAGAIERFEDKIDSEFCGIAPRLRVDRLGRAAVASLETACATALTTAMWEHHSLQPRALDMLGTRIDRIDHVGSYSCRRIRSLSGAGSNWSTHARALALDVSGFGTVDGRTIDLLKDWNDADAEAKFLRSIRDDACDWFGLTLSPDFNSLHADHFHLQVYGWGGCH